MSETKTVTYYKEVDNDTFFITLCMRHDDQLGPLLGVLNGSSEDEGRGLHT